MPLTPMDAIRCCYYLRVMAHDRPGVLSRVAGILGDNDISIANVIQKGRALRQELSQLEGCQHQRSQVEHRPEVAHQM